MSGELELRLNMTYNDELRTSGAVRSLVGDRAEAIARAACSAGHGSYRATRPVDVEAEGMRTAASVWTADAHAERGERKHNTLLKSIDAGRF